MIQEVARKGVQETGLTEFKASNGCLESFRKKQKISFASLSGEESNVDKSITANWKTDLASLTVEFTPDCIYNWDETALFWRALPSKSLVTKTSIRKNVKQLKNRIILYLCCNAVGDKLNSLVMNQCAKSSGASNQSNTTTKSFPLISHLTAKHGWLSLSSMTGSKRQAFSQER